MMQKRYKTVSMEVDCSCGQCDEDPVYLVMDEALSLETISSEDDVLCECYSQESADLIVNALNRLAMN